MKRLYFGPMSATGIFHDVVQKTFRGVEGCITIHDNMLMGVTFKLSKSTFCQREVRWFGRVFSQTGVLADPDKITKIITMGRPESLEDVRSFLQAASYNTRFAFAHEEGQTYEEATAPLRELLGKDKVFEWTREREDAYQRIWNILSL